ncbi:LysE/ArgO family amino acid transporter [Phytoactinopolyspora halotolerans]|uniref:Amino acid transporter n=1 Tax=Phytoactinopolyspora halotolerans TaxID=1981512 RepID=A0A6L9S637_9ACTN|nr:amino acid transporter [Phytoactinopolyspora halotolerans]
MTSLGTGFVTGLTLIVAIGAQNAFVLRQGLRREHVLAVVALCAAADALLITAGVAGLGTLLTAYPAAAEVARYGGAAFLAVYGAFAARRAMNPHGMAASELAPSTRTAVLLTCLGFTFLNPHVYLDTVVVLGSLGNQHGDDGRWLFVIGASCASVTWFVALGYGARALSSLFARPASWRVLDGSIAVVMFALAAGLLVS